MSGEFEAPMSPTTRAMSREGREKSILIMSRRSSQGPVPMTESLFYLNEEMERIQASFSSHNYSTMRSLPRKLDAGNVLRHAQVLQKSHGEFHGERPVWSPSGIGDDSPCFMPKAWPVANHETCPKLLPEPEKPAFPALGPAPSPAPELPSSFAASLEATQDPQPFVCTFTPHQLPHPWMSEPHPKHLVYPNVRPEWCSPSWHAKPVSTAAFLPCGKSKHRIRPLLRAILRKIANKITEAWPDARFRMDPTKGDHIRISVEKTSFPSHSHLALRAYLRNLSIDDRMLDRRVTFQRSEPDSDEAINALYDVTVISASSKVYNGRRRG